MELNEVMTILKTLGSEQSKKVLMKHGAREPFYGVKVADLKKHLVKKIKKNYELSLQLFNTDNSDAMYLAGLIAEPDKMTKKDLQDWVNKAYWYMLSEYTVAWVASESRFGIELGLEWIESSEDTISAAGWATLASVATITPDEQLDVKLFANLLERVENEIPAAPNRTRYAMNGFVISTGSCILPLNNKAKEVAKSIGKITVDMGGTSCKVPYAAEYIKKVEDKGKLGNKKKKAVC